MESVKSVLEDSRSASLLDVILGQEACVTPKGLSVPVDCVLPSHQTFSLDVNRSTSFEIRHSISKEEMTIRGPDKALNRFFANLEQQTGSWLKRRPGQKHVCT